MKNIFTDKKIRYGTFSTVIALVFIAFLIVVNLVIGELDYKIDMTSAETYSISDKTKEVLSGLDEDITIYTMFKTGGSDSIVTRVGKVLDQYARDSHITVENKDLYLYPEFAKQYSTEDKGVNINSLIVTNGSKYRVIDYSEYFDQSGTLNVESCVTSAINYVGLENTPVVYAVTGHGEIEPQVFASFVKQAQLANYEIKTLDLIQGDIPDDCAALFITTSYRDYSDEEVQKVKDYLTNDGRLLFVASDLKKADQPKLLSIINGYGLELGETYVMESDMSNYRSYPFEVFAHMTANSINDSLKQSGYKVLAYGANAVKVLELKKQGLEIEDVLTTSDTAYIKGEGNMSPNPEDGDETGKFTIAAAVTDSSYTDKAHATKIIVCGSLYMLDSNVDAAVNGANASFLVNCLNWLNDTEENVYIAPKSLADGKLENITAADVNRIKVFAWGVIPGILLVFGAVVCLRRYNG